MSRTLEYIRRVVRAHFRVWPLGLAAMLTPAMASANERHFTHTYESAVLAPGSRELELWTTYRAGRDAFYSRFDQRAEFEVGVTDRLMTAFYLNWGATSAADPTTGEIATDSRFDGVSSEWKYKLSDPVADSGSARTATSSRRWPWRTTSRGLAP